jgi:putative transposase
VLPQMAETVGVSSSSINRQAIEGSAEQLRQLRKHRWDRTDLLVIYIDGQRFGAHHAISGVGIDRAGAKHILGIEMGATENAAAVKKLLTGFRDQGLRTGPAISVCHRRRQTLRGIEEVFGSDQRVQRCRNHKVRNVLDELPREQQPQVVNVMRAAWKLTDPEEGMKRLEGLARFWNTIMHRRPAACAREWRKCIVQKSRSRQWSVGRGRIRFEDSDLLAKGEDLKSDIGPAAEERRQSRRGW